MTVTRRVFYNSLGTQSLYDLIRAEMPEGYQLITLESNDDAERSAKVADCDVVIVAATPLTAATINAGRRLRLVHHQGVGYQDTVDVAALAARGIRLALTPEGTSVGVAEHTVLLALAACRRLAFADAELRQGRWHVNSLRAVSVELAGKSIGYLGFGRIGKEAALRFKTFGTVGYYFDPQVSLDPAEQESYGVKPAPFDWIIANTDIVSLHMPLTETSHHILGRDSIARMKPGAIVVNTARGGLIDDAALAEALAGGQLGAAGLDVFEGEPISADHPLCKLPNVVLTPHFSAGTRDAMARKMRAVFTNVERFYRNEPVSNEVMLGPAAEKLGA